MNTVNIEYLIKARKMTDGEILQWLREKAAESGIPDCTITCWISERPELYKMGGAFSVSGTVGTERKSGNGGDSLQEAIDSWKVLNQKSPATVANALRDQARSLLRKAAEIEGIGAL